MIKTLYDALKFVNKGGFDIADDIFECGMYFDITDDENTKDYYNKLMLFFAKKIEFVRYQENFYSICKITEFIESKRKEFDEFMNLYNRNTYQPQNYDYISIDDEGFYDLYINTFENLVIGNYAESSYKKFYNLLNK